MTILRSDNDAKVTSQPEDHKEWSNWAGNIRATPAQTHTPRSEGAVVDLVRAAVLDQLTVRTAGSSLSFSPLVATQGVLVHMDSFSGVTAIDEARGRVRVLAATKISALGAELWARGWALKNQGIIWDQTIAGALSTSTHGTGGGLRGLSSMLTWVRLVNGLGEIVEIGEGDSRIHAMQTGLGIMGIFLEVELEIVPRFFLRESSVFPRWEVAASSWHDEVAKNRNHGVMWLKSDESANRYRMSTPDGETMANRTVCFQVNEVDEVPEADWVDTFGARLGPSYRVLSASIGELQEPFYELEYMVEYDDLLEAVALVQRLLIDSFPEQLNPLFIRVVASDESWMSPFYERETASISVAGQPDTDYWSFLRAVHETLLPFRPRAHWGKLHLLTREHLSDVYPRFDDYVAVRREQDPQGIFLNDHLRALFA